jgi:hypothetical protein
MSGKIVMNADTNFLDGPTTPQWNTYEYSPNCSS